ncbi:uncharacterized protein LOC116948774 [Petromyzon marinus]|uniref:uncharacterized protein LOC116948774 n=1 Tax=Petromyzon marinus TaxID=7757 RepID=UPI003F726210
MAKRDGMQSQSAQLCLWLLLFLAQGRALRTFIEPRAPLVRVGEALQLHCVSPWCAAAAATALPVWRRPGDRPFAPVAGRSLRVAAQGQADAGDYECEVTCGTKKRSGRAQIVVYDVPEELLIEQRPPVAAGGRSVRLTCTVPVVIPWSVSVDFVWYKSDPGGDSARAVGRTDTNVTVDGESGRQAAVGWLEVDAPGVGPGAVYTCVIAINKQEVRVQASLGIRVAAEPTEAVLPPVATTETSVEKQTEVGAAHATPGDDSSVPLVTAEATLGSSADNPTTESGAFPEVATGALAKSSSPGTATESGASSGWGPAEGSHGTEGSHVEANHVEANHAERSHGAEARTAGERRALSAVTARDEDAGVYHCVATAPGAAPSTRFSITVVRGVQRESCHEALATVGGTAMGAVLGLGAGAFMVKKLLSKSYTLCH